MASDTKRDDSRSAAIGHAFNAGIGALARASSQIVTVVVTLYAARMLAPSVFGSFAIAAAWITLVRSTFYSGAYEFLLKASDARKVSSESLAVNLFVGVVLSLPILAIAPFSARLFGVVTVGHLLLALMPSNLFSAFTAWQEALVLRSGKLRSYYLVGGTSEIVSGIAAVALLSSGYGLAALVVQVYVRNVVCLIGFISLRASVTSEKFDIPTAKSVLRWSLSRYYSVFVGMGTNYAADIVLGILLSPVASGLYRASNRIVTAVSDVIAQPARMIAMTSFSALAAEGRDAGRQWASINTLASIIGWSALGGLAVIGPVLVPALLGNAWAPAAALVPVLCAARAMVIVDSLSGVMLVTYDHQRQAFRIQVVGVFVTLAALLVTAPFGIIPATWGVLAASLVMSSIQVVACWRHFPESRAMFRAQAPVVVAPVLATIAGALFTLRMVSVGNQSLIGVVMAVAAGIAAWTFCLALMRRRMKSVVSALQVDPTVSMVTG